MAILTNFLKLFKWDLTNETDLNSDFNIENSLNQNWDKIDSYIQNLQSTLPTTTETGDNILLDKTMEMNYVKAPIPRGNSEQDGEPSPTNEVPISNVTGDVEVLVQNKNLFDKDNVINAYLNADGTTTSNNTFRVSDYINVKGTDNITISGNYGGSEFCCFYDKNKNFISNFGMGSLTTRTASVPSNAEYIRVTVRQDVLNEYQLQKGSTATSFTEHEQQTYSLTLGNIELCKIGNYQDYFYKESNKWYLHKEIGKEVLDGSETYETMGWTGGKNGYRTSINNLKLTTSTTDTSYILSNYFVTYTQTQLYELTVSNYGISNRANQAEVVIRNDNITSASDFKTWLSTHNTTVYYILNTATNTEITDTTLKNELEDILDATSYEEQTNISGTSDEANPSFEVEAYQSLKLLLGE